MTKYKKGFTLIELLVVISIIGVLSSVVLVSVNSARLKADDARRISDLKEIAHAIDMYYSDNGSYPINGFTSTCDGATGLPRDWSASFKNALVPKYIKELPLDPRHSKATCLNVVGPWDYYYGFANPVTWDTWGAGCTSTSSVTVLFGIHTGGKIFQNACPGTNINSIKFTK